MTVPARPTPALLGEKSPPFFCVRFGSGATAGPGSFHVSLPVLAGASEETLFPTAVPLDPAGRFLRFESASWLLGGTTVTCPAGEVEAVTRQLYEELFAAGAGYHLCRIWNYVPAINANDRQGLENYRAFSRGRSLAFERAFGAEFTRGLPAASAVGSDDELLTVLFAAHRTRPKHHENPHQLPAYRYPSEHGPRAPSFARASVVRRPDGRMDVFVSGTSAIKGHATVAAGDTAAQTRCTVENLDVICRECGLDAGARASEAESRHLKVYLRHAADLDSVRAQLEDALLRQGDRVTYLRSDICRAALNVEIELTILGATGNGRSPGRA